MKNAINTVVKIAPPCVGNAMTSFVMIVHTDVKTATTIYVRNVIIHAKVVISQCVILVRVHVVVAQIIIVKNALMKINAVMTAPQQSVNNAPQLAKDATKLFAMTVRITNVNTAELKCAKIVKRNIIVC